MTHAIAGAAVAELFPSNPTAAFIAAFLSHFVMDAIPHWNYKLLSHKKNPSDPLNGDMVMGKKFIIDISKIFLDFSSGIILSLLLFKHQSDYQASILILGALGGMLPDALQFAYWKLKIEPFRSLQKLHRWVHTKHEIINHPIFGVISQAAIIAIIVIASRLLS
jgi:hypothetical protein